MNLANFIQKRMRWYLCLYGTSLNSKIRIPSKGCISSGRKRHKLHLVGKQWYVNLLGNLLPAIRTFNMTFDLVDPDNLILKLSSYQELTAD